MNARHSVNIIWAVYYQKTGGYNYNIYKDNSEMLSLIKSLEQHLSLSFAK